jgi:hypothetical protein
MVTHAAADNLPPELRETFEMVHAAFPDGVPEDAYRPLLFLLCASMSFRPLATVVAAATGKDYPEVYNDVLGVGSASAPPGLEAGEIEKVKERLMEHGYDEWLTHE